MMDPKPIRITLIPYRCYYNDYIYLTDDCVPESPVYRKGTEFLNSKRTYLYFFCLKLIQNKKMWRDNHNL